MQSFERPLGRRELETRRILKLFCNFAASLFSSQSVVLSQRNKRCGKQRQLSRGRDVSHVGLSKASLLCEFDAGETERNLMRNTRCHHATSREAEKPEGLVGGERPVKIIRTQAISSSVHKNTIKSRNVAEIRFPCSNQT